MAFNYFDLKNKLTFIKDVNFRALYHQFLYVECRDVLEAIADEDLLPEDTGLFVYTYIDEDAGITYKPLKFAQFSESGLKFRDLSLKFSNCLLRYHHSFLKQEYHMEDGQYFTIATIPAENHLFFNLASSDVDLEQFAEIEVDVRNTYDLNHDPMKEMLRSPKYDYLDAFRNPARPDDVLVVLFRPDVKPEGVWVRCKFEADNEIFGTLLTEPKEFRFRPGTTIGFVRYGEGADMLLAATGHTSTQLTQE